MMVISSLVAWVQASDDLAMTRRSTRRHSVSVKSGHEPAPSATPSDSAAVDDELSNTPETGIVLSCND